MFNITEYCFVLTLRLPTPITWRPSSKVNICAAKRQRKNDELSLGIWIAWRLRSLCLLFVCTDPISVRNFSSWRMHDSSNNQQTFVNLQRALIACWVIHGAPRPSGLSTTFPSLFHPNFPFHFPLIHNVFHFLNSFHLFMGILFFERKGGYKILSYHLKFPLLYFQ
jgi:hypothetical protein